MPIRSARSVTFLAGCLALAPAAQQPLTLDLVVDETDSFAPVLPKVQWIPGSARYSRVLDGRTGPYVVQVDPRDGNRVHAFAAADLARAVRAAGSEIEDAELPDFRWLDDASLRLQHGGKVLHWRAGEPSARVQLRLPAGASTTVCAPRDTLAASVVDGDLWIAKPSSVLRRITWDGRPGDVEYGGAAHRAEFGIQGGLFFDPAGRRLAFYREDLRPIAAYPHVDYTRQPARASPGRYPMAGLADSVVRLGVYDADDDSVRWLVQDPDADDYLTNVAFTPDGEALVVAVVNRGQDHVRVVRFDVRTGAPQRVLFEEHDQEWVEPEQPVRFEPGSSGRFLWLSARDGHRHFYRYGPHGELLGQVTRGGFDVEEVVGFSPDGAHVFVQASGEDPRQVHLWRAALDGSGLTCLTTGGGRRFATAADEGGLFLLRYEDLRSPGGLRVVDAEGRTVHEIAAATTRLADFQLGERHFFDVRTADGTVLHGVYTLPPGHDPARRAPLLLYVYGGPHSQLVTDAWGRSTVRELWLDWLVCQGCIVATLDNRGTRNRGIDFEQTLFRRLGTLEVEDQLAAVEHLVARGLVDPERVGVHGWSYGGYMTLRLMLLAPDTFRCGAAGAPVTDWRGYETGYTERYMDTPRENPDGYEASSTLPLVQRLRGRLLLVYGSDDRTVMPSHAVDFLERAVAHRVLVDHMLYPMQQHGLQGPARAHLYRLLSRFYTEHLLLPADAPAGGR